MCTLWSLLEINGIVLRDGITQLDKPTGPRMMRLKTLPVAGTGGSNQLEELLNYWRRWELACLKVAYIVCHRAHVCGMYIIGVCWCQLLVPTKDCKEPCCMSCSLSFIFVQSVLKYFWANKIITHDYDYDDDDKNIGHIAIYMYQVCFWNSWVC